MLSEHCVLFVGHRNIMAQSTDPPDIEQSQKYRVKKQKGIFGENSNICFLPFKDIAEDVKSSITTASAAHVSLFDLLIQQ